MTASITRGNATASDTNVSTKGNVDLEVVRDGARWIMEIAYEDAVSLRQALTEYIDWREHH